MRLTAVIIENFRAYHSSVRIPITNLTAFIGRNDIGKSTILEALDIFFEGGTVKMESSDSCVHSASKEVKIGCVFDDLPEDLILDATAETTLGDEFLLNEDGDLEIYKVFDCTKKSVSYQVFAKANHPTAPGYDGLLLLKLIDLKKRFRDLVDQTDIDKRVNAQLRKAIWSSCSREDLRLQPILIQLDKEDAKQIWEQINTHLPIYALFQSDRASKDGDSEVQDPMKIAMKQAVAKVQSQIDEIRRLVELEVTDVAKRTLEKLAEMNPDLATSLTPHLTTEPKWEAFGLTLKGDDDIPINKRGSGIRRLIMLNFFRAEVERKAQANSKQSVIYAIEEPETSQHPNNQQMLIKALLDLSAKPNYQIIITTHVPALAGMIPIESLRYIERVDNQLKIQNGTTSSNSDMFKKVANTLGIQPSPHHPKVIFCVEGIHDVHFWNAISKQINQQHPELPDLSTDTRVAMVAVGGGNLKYWIDYDYLKNFDIPEVHIYDRDVSSLYQPHCATVNSRSNGSWATLTTKRTIENYLHPDAIYEVLNIRITFRDSDDVPLLVAQNFEQPAIWATLDSKAKKKRANMQKHPLNKAVVQKMSYARLQVADPDNDIINWLIKIASYL